jgi:hypothetical protein
LGGKKKEKEKRGTTEEKDPCFSALRRYLELMDDQAERLDFKKNISRDLILEKERFM